MREEKVEEPAGRYIRSTEVEYCLINNRINYKVTDLKKEVIFLKENTTVGKTF